MVGALVLFASERLPPEGVGLLVLLVLALTGVVDAPTAFAGFASPAVITVAAMFILSAGLVEAGAPAPPWPPRSFGTAELALSS